MFVFTITKCSSNTLLLLRSH